MATAERRAGVLFRDSFDGSPEGSIRAPGRVNLIGDRTDYNDGFALPIAIDRDSHIAFRRRTDSLVGWFPSMVTLSSSISSRLSMGRRRGRSRCAVWHGRTDAPIG